MLTAGNEHVEESPRGLTRPHHSRSPETAVSFVVRNAQDGMLVGPGLSLHMLSDFQSERCPGPPDGPPAYGTGSGGAPGGVELRTPRRRVVRIAHRLVEWDGLPKREGVTLYPGAAGSVAMPRQRPEFAFS